MDKELQELAFALIDRAAEKNLAKLSVKYGDFSITVETHAPAARTAEVVQTAQTPAPETKQDAYNGTVISAPLVGTFYAANAPEEPPLTAVGDRVSRGQTLCIIEAMKTMNSIEAPCDGIVTHVLAHNGDLVEFNQPLFVIE